MHDRFRNGEENGKDKKLNEREFCPLDRRMTQFFQHSVRPEDKSRDMEVVEEVRKREREKNVTYHCFVMLKLR